MNYPVYKIMSYIPVKKLSFKRVINEENLKIHTYKISRSLIMTSVEKTGITEIGSKSYRTIGIVLHDYIKSFERACFIMEEI